MLFPIGAHLRGLILTVQFHTGNKYITFGAEREWAVPLLQDHRCVPHVAANKMDPEGAPYFGPLQSLSHWACDVSFCLREGYPIRPGFIQGVGGRRFYIPPAHPILDMPTGRHGYHQSGLHFTQGIRRTVGVSTSKLGPLPSQ